MQCQCVLCLVQYDSTRSHMCRCVCPSCWTPNIRGEIVRVKNAITRARKAGTEATLTLSEWLDIITDFNGKCAYCGQCNFEVLEHFISIKIGGGSTSANCIPSCASCNVRKMQNRVMDIPFPIEWLNRVANYLKGR